MKKSNAVMGAGFVLLAIGLAGLALLQTSLFYRPASEAPLGLSDGKPPGPSQEGHGSRAALERKQVPELPDSIKKAPGPGQVPAPQPVEGPPAPSPADRAEAASGQVNRRPAGNAVGEQEQKPGDLSTEKPIPVPQAGNGERRYPQQGQAERQGTAKPGVDTARNPSADGSKTLRPSPVVLRFNFDPAEKREIDVARVHLGDSISVKVRRFGQADLSIHLAFAVPDTVETGAWREWNAGPRRSVIVPIKDVDRIALTAQGDFGAALRSKLDSKEGAVLKLGADYPRGPRALVHPHGPGGYEIEMTIYPGNRWNIKPRGLV